jgi:sporulation protein YlmC with PRC-barrel domain
MKQTRGLYLLFLLTAFTITVATAKDAAAAPNAESQDLIKADHLLGKVIHNAQGDQLGNLEDLAIDWQVGRVAYGILSYGGYFGGVLDIEDKQFAVPAKALQWVPQEEILLLDVDKKTIEQTQGFDKYDWPNLADRAWSEQLHRQYGQMAYWEQVAPDDKQGSPVDKATAAYMHSQSTGSLQKVTDLIEMDIIDSEGDTVGDIQAVAMDWQTSGEVYAVVSFGGFLGIGAQEAWIPLHAMTLKAWDASAPLRFSDDNYWQLQVSKQQLADDGPLN